MGSLFISRRFDLPSQKTGYVEYECRWCGWRTYADPTSLAFQSQECGDCGGATARGTMTCPDHGQFEVLTARDGSTRGECQQCFEAELMKRRRRRGSCEVCSTKMGWLSRLMGHTRHSSHSAEDGPRYAEGRTDVDDRTRVL